jgi:hypothetical protein
MDFHLLFQDASQWGWTLALLARAAEHLERFLGIRIYRVNLRPLGNPAPDRDATSKGITVRMLSEAELLEAARDPGLELDPDFVREALARGDLACGAYDGEMLVGYTWRAARLAPFRDGLWVKVGHPLHYVYNSFTRESHRGKGIHIAITRAADRYSVETGHPAEVGFIDISNMRSLRAARSLGRRKVGWTGYIKLFGRCFTFRSAGVRATGSEFYVPRKQVAVITLGERLSAPPPSLPA